MQSKTISRLEKIERVERKEPGPETDWLEILKDMPDDELRALVSAREKAGENGGNLYDPVWVSANLSETEQEALKNTITLYLRFKGVDDTEMARRRAEGEIRAYEQSH